MESIALTSDSFVRVSVFLLILLVMLSWERILPRRSSQMSKRVRWTSNLGISLVNVVVLRLTLPMLGYGLAVVSAERGWGLLSAIDLPWTLEFAFALVALDLIIYLQHRMFHIVPIFWRLHRMHHADQEFDATTGVRFHPLEAMVSMCIKSLAIVALGIEPTAYLAFELILNGTSMFNHGNVRISTQIDAWLRWVIVTPDMHRVHHSVVNDELNRNFGFNLPWWDRLFGTYEAQPRAGHEAMQIGTMEFRTPSDLRLDRMLMQPFLPDK